MNPTNIHLPNAYDMAAEQHQLFQMLQNAFSHLNTLAPGTSASEALASTTASMSSPLAIFRSQVLHLAMPLCCNGNPKSFIRFL